MRYCDNKTIKPEIWNGKKTKDKKTKGKKDKKIKRQKDKKTKRQKDKKTKRQKNKKTKRQNRNCNHEILWFCSNISRNLQL